MRRRVRGGLVLAAPAGAVLLLVWAVRHASEDELLLPVAVAGFCAGLARRAVLGAAGLVALLVAILATVSDGIIVPMLMLPATLYAAGAALRGRDEVAERLAAQAAELEAERELYATLSVRYERSRIAAELHDVVAHAISVMVVQAGAGQRLVAADPRAAEGTFSIIGAAARQAEADLDGLAELLGRDRDGGDLDLVRDIVERAQGSGLPVTLRLEGDGDGLRGTTVHVVCRVVQESLTNALRYAPGARVRVAVRVRPARVDVEVANDAVAASPGLGLGSGHGLAGLRERVTACGGTLAAGPDSSGGWAVKASIPRVAVAVG